MNGDFVYAGYKQAMLKLLKSPIAPTEENLAVLFPHLLPEETRVSLGNKEYIATPPMILAGAFHVVGRVSDRDPRLMYHGCFSREKHQAGNIRYVDRAAKFAKMHFGEHFFGGDFQFVANMVLRRFGAMNGGIKAIWLLVNVDPAVLVGSAKKPKSQMIDDRTVYRTVNPIKGREAAALREMKLVYNCAGCGSPLRDQGCEICYGHEIDCYPDFQLGPLPEETVKYLMAKGHVFRKDPFVALARERENCSMPAIY